MCVCYSLGALQGSAFGIRREMLITGLLGEGRDPLKSLASKNGKKAWLPHSRTTSLSLSLSNTHPHTRLLTSQWNYHGTRSPTPHTHSCYTGTGASVMLTACYVLRNSHEHQISNEPRHFTSAQQTATDSRNLDIWRLTKISIYEICQVAVGALNAHDKNTLA